MNNTTVPMGNLPEMLAAETPKLGEDCEALSYFTDGVHWETLAELRRRLEVEWNLSHLLELRVFGDAGEFHAQRSDASPETPFSWRTVQDGDKQALVDYFDDIQRLDRDDAKSELLPEGELITTGGGRYTLPLQSATRIRVRNYIEYDRDGMAHVVDFRIVCLEGAQNEIGGMR